MLDVLLGLGLVIGLVGTLFLWQRIHVQRLARERLSEPSLPSEKVAPPAGSRFVRNWFWLPWVIGLGLAAFLYWGTRLAAQLRRHLRADRRPAGRAAGTNARQPGDLPHRAAAVRRH